jgi:hypothetical protein
MAIKSLDLLPEIFRTDTNRKFLSATIDQLISESNTIKVESYIGRRDAPTFNSSDTYVSEPTLLRQNYQLEPTAVVKDSTGQVDFFSSYQDLLQQINYLGGTSADHSRLFSNESYNFDGVIDFDKFVNFNQYLWLPNGPPEVEVGADALADISEFTVARDLTTESYNFTGFGTDQNPILTLIKGNTYRFRVNQPGQPFWIQTQIGVTGSKSIEAEELMRNVYGVDDNGSDTGVVTFRVPLSSAQDNIVSATLAATVDFATELSYNEIQNHMINLIPGGIDGVKSSLDGKTIIFINRDENNTLWTDAGVFDVDPFDLDSQGFEYGLTVPGSNRFGVFRIRTVDAGAGRRIVRLEHIQNIDSGEKVFVRSGNRYANVEIVKNDEGFFEVAPPVTAPLDELFYQDGTDPLLFGRIKLVDPGTAFIDIASEVIGKVNYTSPNGVAFTNSMVVRFDNNVTPAFYAGNAFVIEGVGKEIRLRSVTDFLVPEQYASDGLDIADYITINRGSRDLNAWSRSNRWFHIQVVELAAQYRKDPTLLDISNVSRANRPIIEFDSDLYLFDYGQRAKSPVDIIDFLIQDAFREVEGKLTYVVRLPNGVTRQLTPGTRIIFAADLDPEVRRRIYRVEYVTTATGQFIHLVSQSTQLLPVYEVSDSLITANLSYDFMPTVEFEEPLPVIGARRATGEVVLKPTGISSIDLEFGGANYIADPYIRINSAFETSANLDIVYRQFKSIDYIRVDRRGTGYSSSSPAVTIDSPNEYYGIVSNISLGSSTFELSGVTSAQWSGIQVGMQVIGPGIVGGTLITAVDDDANLISISAPAVTFNLFLGQTGLSVVNIADQFIFKSEVASGDYAVVSADINAGTEIVVDDTSMIAQGMIVSGGLQPITVNNVIISVVPTRVLTNETHNYQDGDIVLVRGIVGTTELNNTRFYVQRISDTAFDLHNNVTLTSPQDSRNFNDYVSGGVLTAYTIDYANTFVTDVISPTRFRINNEVTIKAGTKLVFGGVTAQAIARSDGTGVYTITVTNPGAGYLTTPNVSIASGSGLTSLATAIPSHGIIDYVRVTDPGNGYVFSSDLAVEVINSVLLETVELSPNNTNVLYFENDTVLEAVQPGWLVFLVTNRGGKDYFTDFSQVPYAETETTGPDADEYRFYMDVSKTRATILTVQSKDSDRIVLSGNITARDSDGEVIDLPVGSQIFFTCQDIFFTEDGVGTSPPIGSTEKNTFIVSREASETNVIELEHVLGVQPGMLLQDLSDTLASDIRVVSVDAYLRNVTLSKNVILPVGVPIKFSTGGQFGIQLNSAEVDYITITDPGAGYVKAPKVIIEPVLPVVTKLASCTGTDVLSVGDFDGVVVGAKVTSAYDNAGIGIETGADVPVVTELFSVQTGSNRFEFRIRLNRPQPVFSDILITFTRAAEAVALMTNTNNAFTGSDETPETYEAGDTLCVNTPANQSQLQRVLAFNQFYFNGIDWIPSQQKTNFNQAPLFDAFDETGASASDSSVYPASKFVGTRIFGYTPGTGAVDTVLGFALKYRNFQNVGDIEFSNYFETDTFGYLQGFGETNKAINSFTLRKSTETGFELKNLWSAVQEPTRQYQTINHVFDGSTNYFETDILPEDSRTIPNHKVYVETRLLDESTYRIEKFGGRFAVIIDVDQLELNNRVRIVLYSKTISKLGYYDVPSNFAHNPLNTNFQSLTLGQIRNHLSVMASNHYGVRGDILGSNNLRDLDIKGWQGLILQHSSPVVLSSLFMTHQDLNAIRSIEFAQKEYVKFKHRFLDAATKIQIDINDIPASVDLLMADVMSGKNNQSPWFGSDMVPFGNRLRIVTDIPVLNVRQRTYLIPNTFDPTKLQMRSVLIYLRDTGSKLNRQLVRDQDVVFNTDASSITIADSVELTYTSYISVVDYTDTTECYVPETPTKLGLYPRFMPRRYLDNTYLIPAEVIQGHDGSITPVFGDFRDDLLLELELRIYNSIKIDVNNNGMAVGHDLYNTVPGKFRDTGYGRIEFNRLTTRSFLNWVGNNQLDYNTNTNWDATESFTWNYARFKDITGENLPGYWRGVYKYYYDTDRPHLTPWEMLGFSEKPTWWEARYGTAPYTGGNRVLWDDLEAGRIYAGNRAGIDLRFARPGLRNFVPVDDTGNLIAPQKLVVTQFNSIDTNTTFVIGDHGPVETAWRRSSEYPFAVQVALALSRPAFYFANLFDTSRYYYNSDLNQYLLKNTQTRISPDRLLVPDVGVDGVGAVLTSGYANWIRDYLTYRGLNGTAILKENLSKIDVNLGYQVAGFTDKKILQVVAEQSSPGGSGRNIVVPDENYTIHLHKSAPTRRVTYSAVIVERTDRGWKVSGYDLARPYFVVVPSEVNNNASSIEVLKLKATIYKDFQLRKLSVPYGYEFRDYQQIVDFLVSYQRALQADGFVFDEYNIELALRQDWTLSAQEFLTWIQQGWQTGSILVLSPTRSRVKIRSNLGVIDEIRNEMTGNRLLDQNFTLIRRDAFTVMRDGTEFVVQGLLGQTVGLADLSLVEYEHVIIFDNVTVFNDIIYSPPIGNRQSRLKLIGYKSSNWNGQLNAPGYIYNDSKVDEWVSRGSYRRGSLVQFKEQFYVAMQNVPESTEFEFNYWKPVARNDIKTGLLPNFSLNADKFRNFYDVDNVPRDEDLEKYSTGLIGFRNRAFFQDFDLGTSTQAKFYQGYIRHKGTKQAIDSLTAGKFDNVDSEINFYEEWALRVGEYGAAGGDQYLEVILDEQQFTDNPSTFKLLGTNEAADTSTINFDFTTTYRTSEPVFTRDIIQFRSDRKSRIGDNVAAGYPRIDDVDGTIYNISQYPEYSQLVERMGSGFKLWTAVDFNKSWNVYRATETNVQVVNLTLQTNRRLLLTFDRPHGSYADDFVAIKNYGNKEFDGFYRVINVVDNLNFIVQGYKGFETLNQSRELTSSGVFFRMVSVRYATVREILNFVPPNGWRDADRAWVDNDTDSGAWGVYEKTDGWEFNQLLPLRTGDDRFQEGYGNELKINNDNQIIIAGTPNHGQGSLLGLRVIDPGEGYESPAIVISPPTGTPGVQALFSVNKTNGELRSANVVNAGNGYTVAPNVIISDFVTTTSLTETINVDDILVNGNILSNIYVGDTVSGDGLLPGATVTFINTSANLVQVQVETVSFLTTAVLDIYTAVVPGPVIFEVNTSSLSLTANLGIRAFMSGNSSNYFNGYVQSFDAASITLYATDTAGNGASGSWLLSSQLYVPANTELTFSRGAFGQVRSILTGTTVDSVEIINGGTGFVLTPQVQLVGGGGFGAEAVVVLSGGTIQQVIITDPGSGYTEAPTVVLLSTAISTVDLRAKLTPTSVSNLIIANKGEGYREPRLEIVPGFGDGGYEAQASIGGFTANAGIQSILVSNRGRVYSANTFVSLNNIGSGVGFEATVNVFANGAINSVTVTNSGEGYDPGTTAVFVSTGGVGATGTVSRTNDGIAEFSGTNVLNLGQGYLQPPTVQVIDQAGSGTGARVEAIFPTGQVKTFLRPDQNALDLDQTELIKPFSNDAREFGYSVDIGTLKAVIGAPASYDAQGAALISQSLGSQWISYQMLYPPNLDNGARFGHSVAFSNDEQWIYVGAPGMNSVYCYGRKIQTSTRITLTPVSGVTNYITPLVGLQTAYEVKVLGTDGRLYEPIFDYDVDGLGNLYFADYARIADQPNIYVARQRLNTTIIPTVIRNILQRTYALESQPDSIDQVLVFGATGRVFVPNKEFVVVGPSITFLDDTFATEPSIIVNQRDEYYQLVDILTPPDNINEDSNFGWSVRTDAEGYRIVVGAPDVDDEVASVGRAYVFNRSYEVFTTSGTQNIFTLASLRNVVAVTLDSQLLRDIIDYTVQSSSVILTAVPRNGAKLQIDTNFFNITQIIPAVSKVNVGRFGFAVDISPDNRSVVVSSPGYRDEDYYNGAVYRFVNKGLFYGKIVSTKTGLDMRTVLGDSIKINDKTVILQSSTGSIDTVFNTIRQGELVATDVAIVNDRISISIIEGTALAALDILPGTGTGLADIGLEIYGLTQTLFHPGLGVPERFGVKIRIDDTGNTLAVSSEGGNTLKTSTFDSIGTVFDADTTRFIDSLNASGAVYIYDYLSPPGETFEDSGKMLYNQVLQNSFILTGDNFGSAVDLNKGWAVVGANRSNYYSPQAGLVHLFINDGNIKGWSRLRQRGEVVDIDFINRVSLYDRTTQNSIDQLDYFDPAKGKILGIADQDIDYKTSYDPAYYTTATRVEVTVSNDTHWNQIQLGQVWWDLSLCRYIDYEQGDLGYRSKYWGELFPGSTVEICEWVQSIYLPSQYEQFEGDGVAKYADDSAYVIESYYDDRSGLIKTRYYYWVKNKKIFDKTQTSRNNSVVALESIIRNPASQDVAYIAVLAPNAFSVYNTKDQLKGTDVVLRIEYSRVISDIIAHSEYQLIQQGNELDAVPEKLVSKLIDSLSGENSAGQVVPDLQLREADAYGIGLLPRQSMIRNGPEAARVFVSLVNQELIKKQVVELRNLVRFNIAEEIPPANIGFYTIVVDTVDQLNYIPENELFAGFKVLVTRDSDFFNYWTVYEWISQVIGFRLIRIQSFDTTRWWRYEDWYASGYDKYTTINHVVTRYNDTLRLNLAPKNVVKVMNDSRNEWALYIANDNLSLTKIARQNGTIQLENSLFDYDLSFTGFDNAAFDQVGFSTTQSVELRNIFEGLVYDIFINEDRVKTNNLFFTLLNYILSEQPAVDWALKTSFISILHKIRKLEQFPNYIRDNQDYYQDYINEVKPYRTQIRDYLLDYQGDDEALAGATDFDLPSVYDRNTKTYRPLQITSAQDLALIRGSERNAWLKNYAYQIQDIVLQNGGSGYIQAPRIAIVGGSGTGATARAVLGPFTNGTASVVSVVLTNSGSGYTSQPTVEFIGGGGVDARASLLLQDSSGAVTISTLNRKVRNIITTLKFDRISYGSDVREWEPYELYRPGDIIVVPDVRVQFFANYDERQLPRYNFVYRILRTLLGTNAVDLNVFQDPTIVERLSGDFFDNANDRVAAYYQPHSPDNAKIFNTPDLIRLIPATINDEIVSVANKWNSVSHSGVVPAGHEYQYAAVGDRSLIALSRDGINWITTTITDTGVNCRDIVLYRGTQWVAIGNQGTLFYTDNGIDWFRDSIDQYRYSANVDNTAGLLQENVAQALDATSVASAQTTFSDYLVVVGNNGLILSNARGNSAFRANWDIWYKLTVQDLAITQNYLKIISVDLGYLEDNDGTRFQVSMQPVSGYHVTSTLTGAAEVKLGYLITTGINGAINMISYMNLDDSMQGYISGYNYNNGKEGAGGTSYPWIKLTVPTKVRGLNDGYSGEQITDIAVSGRPDGTHRWMVAVGSSGTLLWNKFDTPLRIRDGRAELAADTIGQTVIDHQTFAFENFREFESSSFTAPLTKDQLDGININDIVWDGVKFVAVGSKGLILWGFPGVHPDAYIDITDITGATSVNSRRPGASWTGGSTITSLSVSISNSDLDGALIVPGMTCYADALPEDAVVTAIALGSGIWVIDLEFSATTVATVTESEIAFSYVLTDNIAIDSTITATNGTTTQQLNVSKVSLKGETRFYIDNFEEQVQANWQLTGTGIPAGARVKSIGKFANFRWQQSTGNRLDDNTNYRAAAVNSTIVSISQPLAVTERGIRNGDLITMFDPTGTRIQVRSTQNLRAGITSICIDIDDLDVVRPGYQFEANTITGILSGTTVIGTENYVIGGVNSRLAKDIPDNVPGTSYPGTLVLGQEFTSTATDSLSLDTDISSSFVDSQLGQRPEDIIVDGGKFIDTYSSHAPEELVPGQVIDSLQMTVFTANIVAGLPNFDDVIAFKLFTDYRQPTVYYRLAEENTTALAENLAYDDIDITVTDISKLPDPNPDANILGTIWLNGEKIVYLGIDRANSKLTNIRRGASRTSIPVLHLAGSLVTDASSEQFIDQDTVLTITENTTVENGIVGGANSATYLSATVTSIGQGQIWQDLT